MKAKSTLFILLAGLVLAGNAVARVFVATNSTWRYFKGSSEASTPTNARREVDFDDSAWLVGGAPFHFGTNVVGGDGNLAGGTILSHMRGNYTCVFLRQPFVLADTQSVQGLRLNAWIDDGLAVLINGQSAPLGRSRWTFWQYRWDMPALDAGTGAPSDWNRFNGSLEDLYAWAGVNQYDDVETNLFDGSRTINGTRKGWGFTLDIRDKASTRMEIVHGSFTRRLSVWCVERKASIAYNGGDWIRETLTPFDYSVSDYAVYVPRKTAVPSFMGLGDGSIVIDHNKRDNVRYATSGQRYVVLNGVPPAYLDRQEPQYTEGHARTFFGLDRNGNLMVCVCNGLYPNMGLTLKEAARDILVPYGALIAFDGGGGGDSTRAVQGLVTNMPQDVLEKSVPETVLIYAKELNTMATYEINLKQSMSLRADHSTDGAKIGSVPMGISQANQIWTAPADLFNAAGTKINQVGDKWAFLPSLNGWVALVHLGIVYGTFKEIIPTPATVDMNLAPGSVLTVKDASGNVLWTGEA